MIIDYLILKIYSHMKEERTLYAVYHLLKGKRSIQTVQDAHLYNITDYYGIYKNLTLNEYEIILNKLKNEQKIKKKATTDTYIITPTGLDYLKESKDNGMVFLGIKYNSVAPSFYKRILLFIQVWANSNQASQNYLPIIEDFQTENFIKSLYRTRKTLVKADLSDLYGELGRILSELPDKYALIYVERLTGYKHYGLSLDQLALKNKLSKHSVELILTSINHQIISVVSTNHSKYKTLNLLIEDLITKNNLTLSASKTYQLFSQNKNLQEIASMRNLKLNTIYDHIIEIALYDTNFDIEAFVTPRGYDEIVNYVETYQTFKLKDIKENINEEITYFQIRLVLSTIYT